MSRVKNDHLFASAAWKRCRVRGIGRCPGIHRCKTAGGVQIHYGKLGAGIIGHAVAEVFLVVKLNDKTHRVRAAGIQGVTDLFDVWISGSIQCPVLRGIKCLAASESVREVSIRDVDHNPAWVIQYTQFWLRASVQRDHQHIVVEAYTVDHRQIAGGRIPRCSSS
ncbi:hypothetical protein D3C71_1465170 [compost metagenome]